MVNSHGLVLHASVAPIVEKYADDHTLRPGNPRFSIDEFVADLDVIADAMDLKLAEREELAMAAACIGFQAPISATRRRHLACSYASLRESSGSPISATRHHQVAC